MKDTNKFAIVIEDENIRLVTLNEDVGRPWDLAKKILGDVLLEVVKIEFRGGSFCGLIHEEGKMEGLEHNKLATRCSGLNTLLGDYIAGPMVICCNDEDLSALDKAKFDHFDFFMTVARKYFCANTEQQSSS